LLIERAKDPSTAVVLRIRETQPPLRMTKEDYEPRQTRSNDMAKKCKHLNEIKVTTTDEHVCEECVKMGDTWVHLRMCMSCGKVGCCDSSKNKHATKHFHQSKHPLIRSIQPGEDWIWCYVDEIMAGEVAA
jgi:uncharacterized UBP type Zn finger protein